MGAHANFLIKFICFLASFDVIVWKSCLKDIIWILLISSKTKQFLPKLFSMKCLFTTIFFCLPEYRNCIEYSKFASVSKCLKTMVRSFLFLIKLGSTNKPSKAWKISMFN